MKKTFVSPKMETVKIEVSQMIASSPGLGGSWSSADPILGREGDLDDLLGE